MAETLSLDLFEETPERFLDNRLVSQQVYGSRLLASKRRWLLADLPGTGKTLQALLALERGASVIVACPSVAKGVWARECRKWRPDFRTKILEGRRSFRMPEPGEIIIINYEILPGRFSILGGVKITLIGDEIHNVRNLCDKTQRFKSLADAISAAGGNIWGLSGSPFLNLPPELWNVLDALHLAEDAFGSFPNMRRLFCARKTRFGLQWGDPLPMVPELLKRVMLRRTRDEIFPGMKGKFHSITPVKIDRKTRDLCEEAALALQAAGISLDEYVDLAASTATKGAAFHQVSAALTALATAKIPTMLEVADLFDDNGQPLLIFSAHRNPIDALAGRKGWATITGDTSAKKRTEIEDAFQAGHLKGVGLMIQAGGVAITLTRAHNGLFVDRTHVPDINSQAEDRMDRKGQEKLVQIDDLVADHRLDERRTEILIEKQGRINKTYGAKR